MKKITIWSTVDKNGESKFNHIEDGWAHRDHPQPIKKEFTNQKAWSNLKWSRLHGYLLDGKVIKVIKL